MRNIIIHICGYESFDKTKLTNKLKDEYNEKIYIKDLKEEFYQQISKYEDFIDLFIQKYNDKPLILLDVKNCLENFYTIDTKYKYFITDKQTDNIECKKIYKQNNYKFIDSDKIIDKVIKIIENKKKYMKNYKIIKKLGAGLHGSVYLVKNKKTKKKYAMKVEKVIEKNLKSQIYRELDFSQHMTTKYPQQFMKIYEYKNKKCSYVNWSQNKLNEQNKLNNIDIYEEKYYRELIASPYCSITITSIVDDTIHYIIYKLDDKKIILDLFIQIVNIAYLINKEGYYHRDLTSKNIGVVLTKDKYITILDKKVLTHGYILQAIDYGTVLHKKYILKKSEIDALTYNNDMYYILQIIISRIMLKNLNKYYYKYIYDKVLNDKILISEQDSKILEQYLENIKANNYNYFKQILYKIIFFDKFQTQLAINKKVKLFDFIPVESVIFIVKNFYDLKKILEHLISL